VAALGADFLVVGGYAFDGSLVATRISGGGQILQSSMILVSELKTSGAINLPRAAAVGGRWLVVWSGVDVAGCNCVWGAFFDSDGTFGNAFKISGPLGDCQVISWGLEPQIASAGDSALVVYRGLTTAGFASDLDITGGITARRVKADGTFDVDTTRGFLVSPRGFVPSVAWDGSGYLAAWFDPRNALYPPQSSGDIYAARITDTGLVFDTDGLPVANSHAPEDQPAGAARNGVGVFAWSALANQAPYGTMRIHLRTVRGSFLLPPVAPQLFSYSVGWNASALIWRDNSSNEDGFKIERCAGMNCTNFAEIARVPANTTRYDDVGLVPQSWYSYRLRAFNSVGDSAYTEVAQLLTADPPSVSITGRLTDRNGKGLENYSVTLSGSQSGFARTDKNGYYRLSSINGGGNYRVTPQSPGPRINFTTYYPNPGWVEFKNLAADQVANIVYNLTSPWVPPDATPTPTPAPTPTPTPTPLPGNDGAILNPNFDQGGANWMTGGAVSFTNGVARLTPTTSLSPASISQSIALTPGAGYEVAADLAATATTRVTFGVRFDDGSTLLSGPSVNFTNNTRPTTYRVRFTVPAGANQTGVYVQASGSISSGSWATADNFRLTRMN